MNSSASLTFKKINSSKQLSRELATAAKLFQGKETEQNWDKREQTLLWLKSLLHHTFFDNWKDIIIRGVHDLVFGIADAIQSLRTKYALVAFDLITEIGHVIGTKIDATTFETIFTSLLKCGNSSKQMIATKANHTTVSFLTTTSYHNKAITLLCSTFNDDKNPQSRDFIAIYLKTCLQTHAPRVIVRDNMERLNTLKNIEGFLKTGIVDATPSVRQTCRTIFWIYHLYWPMNAERLLKFFDLTTRKQLQKSKSSDSTTDIKRQNTSGKRPKSPMTLSTNDPSQLRINSTSKSSYESPLSKRRAVSSNSTLFEEPVSTSPPLASASLLHLLRSQNTSNNCNGLRILSKRLGTHIHRCSSSNSYEMVLPPTVPSRADLMPILLNYLSLDRMMKNELLCEQLMSWDCLSGIFVHVFSLHHFLPTLLLAGGRTHHYQQQQQQQQHCQSQCALGLKRLKLYLKYNDPDLFQSLVDLLLTTTVPGTPGLRDPNAKNELRKTTTQENGINGVGDKTRDDLILELIYWLDDIVCKHVGLDDESDNDDDSGMMAEYQQQPYAKYTTASNDYVCTQWFEDNDKLTSCLVSILDLLKSYTSTTTHSVVFASLITLVARLRLVSICVFDLVVAQAADKDLVRLLDTCFGQKNSGMNILCHGDGGVENLVEDSCCDDGTDDPPPAYNELFDGSLLVCGDDDDDDRQQQHEPSFIMTSLNQQNSEDGLSDGNDDYDVLDTSWGSINLEIMSPEPSIASTQDPSELDDFTMEHTASVDEDLESETSPLECSNDNEPNSATISFSNDKAPSIDTTISTTDDINDSSDLLTKTVEQLLNTTTLEIKQGILGKLEHLCKEYVVKNETDYGKNGIVWVRTTTFGLPLQCGGGGSSLLKTLIGHLTDDLVQQQQQQQQIMAILRLIKQILLHQCFLFQQQDNEEEAEMIANAVLYTKREKYGRIPTMIDEIHDLLVTTINIRSFMSITARLLKQQYDIYLKDQNDKSPPIETATSMTRAHPMSTLFSMVAKMAPRLKPELMDEFLTKKGCSDCFLQAINHPVISIRQSCVNALVALSYASGTYHDIKHYLPNLRKEQQTLLDYYINQRQ